jgi:hypothetical protein
MKPSKLTFLGMALVLLVALFFSCSKSTDSSDTTPVPDYVGTWRQVDVWGTGTGTLTITFSTASASWAITGGSYGTGTIGMTLVADTTLKHITATVTSVSGDSTFTAQMASMVTVSTVFRMTYLVSGTTMYTSNDPLVFPSSATTAGPNAGSGQFGVFTKI